MYGEPPMSIGSSWLRMGTMAGDDEIRQLYTSHFQGSSESMRTMDPKDFIRAEQLFDDDEVAGIEKREDGEQEVVFQVQLMPGQCIYPSLTQKGLMRRQC